LRPQADRRAVVLAIVFGVNVVHDAMDGPQAAWFAELFDTRVRYSGSSPGHRMELCCREGLRRCRRGSAGSFGGMSQ
jgi:MFS transporter, MHS family, shikimate and dehydroshikimate transport protein